MIILSQVADENSKHAVKEIVMKLHDDLTVDELLEAVEQFMKACGYSDYKLSFELRGTSE